MSNAKFIEKWCLKKVRDIERDVIDKLPKNIEKATRLNFNRAKREIPAFDTNIDVFSTKLSDHSAKIVCGGTQVLFVEFGAGVSHATETYSNLISADEVETEWASRPSGIYPLGHYGLKQGKNDSWIFKDTNLIADNGKNHTHLIRSNQYYFVYRTGGIRPVRALHRAVGSGVKKLTLRKIIRR